MHPCDPGPHVAKVREVVGMVEGSMGLTPGWALQATGEAGAAAVVGAAAGAGSRQRGRQGRDRVTEGRVRPPTSAPQWQVGGWTRGDGKMRQRKV